MTDWYILPGLKIDVLIACCRLPVNRQNVECCSRYSASGHLQKFAADLTLSTPENSQPCKIVTLSLNSNQDLQSTYSNQLKFPLCKLIIKISLVLSNQKIVKQHFDLYNNHSILITIFRFVKFFFRELRFHPSSHSSPFLTLSRLKKCSLSPLLISYSSALRC